MLIEQRNYSNLSTYVFKAEAALDASTAAASNSTAPPLLASASSTSSIKKKSAERENVQSKLDLAVALSHLSQGNYEKAAQAFLKIGPAKELGDWVGKVHSCILNCQRTLLIVRQLIAPGDIAIYGTLCALASFQRPMIKSKVLENSLFSAYIEQEPYVRDLIESYMSSNFKSVLEILNRYSV